MRHFLIQNQNFNSIWYCYLIESICVCIRDITVISIISTEYYWEKNKLHFGLLIIVHTNSILNDLVKLQLICRNVSENKIFYLDFHWLSDQLSEYTGDQVVIVITIWWLTIIFTCLSKIVYFFLCSNRVYVCVFIFLFLTCYYLIMFTHTQLMCEFFFISSRLLIGMWMFIVNSVYVILAYIVQAYKPTKVS